MIFLGFLMKTTMCFTPCCYYKVYAAVFDHVLYNLGFLYVSIFIKILVILKNTFIFLNGLFFFKKLVFIIFMFLLYLYIRASVPRYKLVDFQNFY